MSLFWIKASSVMDMKRTKESALKRLFLPSVGMDIFRRLLFSRISSVGPVDGFNFMDDRGIGKSDILAGLDFLY